MNFDVVWFFDIGYWYWFVFFFFGLFHASHQSLIKRRSLQTPLFVLQTANGNCTNRGQLAVDT